MVKLEYKLKASTLIESLIAMVIIVVCVGIATTIYVNVLDSDKQRQKLKAALLLDDIAIKTKAGKNFLDEEMTIENWKIKKTVGRYKDYSNLYQFTLKVIDSENKRIALRNELIVIQ